MKETPTRKIINVFLKNNAKSQESAISIDYINVDIKENEKIYIINSLLSSEYLIYTVDNKLWFNEKQWSKSIRKLTLQYSLILIIPIVIAVLLQGTLL